MSFQPILPLSGLAGWAFLNRTKERQEASFNATPMIERDVAYFKEQFPRIQSASELVENRRMLKVALGAFGLQDDLDNRAFIRQILEGGTEDRRALANRLADKRYLAFATAFSFLAEPGLPAAGAELMEQVVTSYRSREFEIAVGEQDRSMRLALTLQRELPELADSYTTDQARWFAILGNPPLREVLEISLGFPKEFANLDIDTQLSRMQAAARKRYGTSEVTELAQDGRLSALTERFLVMSQIAQSPVNTSSASVALLLLGGADPSPGGALNLG